MIILLLNTPLPAQQHGIDTSSAAYPLGKTIGSWLPFIVMAVLFILMWRAAMRRESNHP